MTEKKILPASPGVASLIKQQSTPRPGQRLADPAGPPKVAKQFRDNRLTGTQRSDLQLALLTEIRDLLEKLVKKN